MTDAASALNGQLRVRRVLISSADAPLLAPVLAPDSLGYGAGLRRRLDSIGGIALDPPVCRTRGVAPEVNGSGEIDDG